MKQVLLGYRPYDFPDKNGEQVKGISLYTQCESEGVTGYMASKLSVKTVPVNIDDFLGCEIDV